MRTRHGRWARCRSSSWSCRAHPGTTVAAVQLKLPAFGIPTWKSGFNKWKSNSALEAWPRNILILTGRKVEFPCVSLHTFNFLQIVGYVYKIESILQISYNKEILLFSQCLTTSSLLSLQSYYWDLRPPHLTSSWQPLRHTSGTASEQPSCNNFSAQKS